MAWDQATLNQYAKDAKSLGWESIDGGKKIWDWAQQNGVDNTQLTTALNSAYGGNRDAAWADQYVKDQGWGQPAKPATPAMPEAPQYQAPQFAPVQAAQVQGLGVNFKPALEGLLGGQVNNPYLAQMAGNISDQAWQGYNRGTAGQIRDQFQASSQYGTNRQGIAEGIAMGDLNRGLADSIAGLYGNAYEAAQGRQAQIAGQLAGYQSQADITNAQLQQEAALANSGRDVDVWKAQQGFNLQSQGLANDWALGQGNLDLNRLTQSQNFDLGNRTLAQQGSIANRDLDLRSLTQQQNLDLGNRTLAQQGALANRGYDIQETGQKQQYDISNRTLEQNGLLGNRRIDADLRLGEMSAQTAAQNAALQASTASQRLQFDRDQFGYTTERNAAQDMRASQWDPLIYQRYLIENANLLQGQQQNVINGDRDAYNYNANADWERKLQWLNAVNSGQGNNTSTQSGGQQGGSAAAGALGGAVTGAQLGRLAGYGTNFAGNYQPVGGYSYDPWYG